MTDQTSAIVVIISLIFSAFFSGIEIAFISADKLQIELKRQQGTLYGRVFSPFLNKPSWFISTTLIGNNISLVVYGIFMAFLLEPFFQNQLPDYLQTPLTIFVLQTTIATLVVLIVAEFLPKSLSLIDPNRMLEFFAVPLYLIYIVLLPAVGLVVGLSKLLIVKILGWEFSEEKPVFGLIDLNQYFNRLVADKTTQQRQEIDAQIFTNALEFKAVKVRECQVPRPEIVTVDIEDSIEDLEKAFIESGYSKILVMRDSIDNIIGYCHSLEMFKKPKQIGDILTPITIVPETMLANELLVQFITERKSIALVVDEFGGTSGIVTLEDIIEEIFGDIQDEHDEEDLLERMIDNQNYLLSARHEIDYLNEKYRWNLPIGDYDTLGGLILSIAEDIPDINTVIETQHFIFTILSLEDNRIDQVKLTLIHRSSAG
jgi:putative hemolysin